MRYSLIDPGPYTRSVNAQRRVIARSAPWPQSGDGPGGNTGTVRDNRL